MQGASESSRLRGKTALITGGGSGIGRAIAERFATEGASLVLLEIDETRLANVLADLEMHGGEITGLTCDVGDHHAVHAAVQHALKEHPRIDILVNNAGIAHVGNVEQTTESDLDRLYRVNIKGVYNCLHAIVPHMRESGGGAVLNLASIVSKVGILDRFAYSMTKGAVLTMTLSVARDYVDAKIRCNCVCPARVHTPFVDGYLAEHYPDNRDEMFERLSAYQPIGRMGKPEEIASLALFLCSDEAAFITGSAFDIDGGVIQLR